VRPVSSYHFAQPSIAISLYRSEVARASHEFPVVFTAEPDGYFPAALMGLTSGRNAFVDVQGRWLAGYIPAVWRRGAFRLARVQDREEWVLCLDLDSELIGSEEGHTLFDAEGKPTEWVGQVMRFLGQLEQDRAVTLNACAALDRLGLLVPLDLQVKKQDGSALRLDGLFQVDEVKLNTLPGEGLSELQAAGALSLAYCHLFSLHKLTLLGKLAAQRNEEAERHRQLKEGKLDLDRVFGIVEDDPFIF
jgi:hypothetical protein